LFELYLLSRFTGNTGYAIQSSPDKPGPQVWVNSWRGNRRTQVNEMNTLEYKKSYNTLKTGGTISGMKNPT
jgi:hypothetical protein